MNVCLHEHTEKRRLITSNGSTQIKEQCLDCGIATAGPLKLAANPGWEDFPLFDQEVRDGGWQARSAERARERAAADAAWRAAHLAHLDSPSWKQMRLRLFVDRRGICEGCGRNLMIGCTSFPPYFEAHHVSGRGAYKVGFGNELLFQLALLCGPCHDQIPSKFRDEMVP